MTDFDDPDCQEGHGDDDDAAHDDDDSAHGDDDDGGPGPGACSCQSSISDGGSSVMAGLMGLFAIAALRRRL
ncbi:MAG: hypothetical protein KDA24_12880 [Deltaproteobacteria bacterium]|nr:hypothetical protein [Deltaproteobacteria bacterium]